MIKKSLVFKILFCFCINIINNTVSSAQPCYSAYNKKKHYRFKNNKKTTNVSTSDSKFKGVYICSKELLIDDSLKVSYKFYRFWDNGRVYISWDYCSFPDSTHINTLNYGNHGIYWIRNDTIIIETYSRMGGYSYQFLKKEKDVLTFIGTGKRRYNPGIILTSPDAYKNKYNYYYIETYTEPFW
jgi:hypothetical protein